MRRMARDLLDRLHDRMNEDLIGLKRLADGLSVQVECRYSLITVRIQHDRDAEMLRVSTTVPPPAGSGQAFLLWSLGANAIYWDVKLGLNEAGLLLVHSDLDAHRGLDIDELASAVIERVETVVELLSDDLVEWIIGQGLGTPKQKERWAEDRWHMEPEEEGAS